MVKRGNLWDKVSNSEKKFFSAKRPAKKELQELSWRLESALTLGWALGLIDELHEIDQETTETEMEKFVSTIPEPGDLTIEFLSNLSYRNLEEVYLENLLNEIATNYFRDLFLLGREDPTEINRLVSYERHQVLNWVRKFCGSSDWDHVDTST